MDFQHVDFARVIHVHRCLSVVGLLNCYLEDPRRFQTCGNSHKEAQKCTKKISEATGQNQEFNRKKRQEPKGLSFPVSFSWLPAFLRVKQPGARHMMIDC
jgi:hypothetical protein